ncbi:MAG TPA: EVE domain-containing protein [Thermoanaerobaculia bacterium]|nr:EVE domain-containing protein [Thermoanaerobaculia bacterium]
MDWLLKTEPEAYSFDDLTREKKTVWDGVANPVALKHLASMKKGERLVVYHTGKERAAVGLATVASAPRPDPRDAKLTVVEIAAGKRLAAPVSLGAIKASPLFASSPLVRMGRLSVVPLTPEQHDFLAGRRE